jgi:hypothetical protein
LQRRGVARCELYDRSLATDDGIGIYFTTGNTRVPPCFHPYTNCDAELTRVPSTNVVAIETDLPWEELAAIPESYATAWTALIGIPCAAAVCFGVSEFQERFSALPRHHPIKGMFERRVVHCDLKSANVKIALDLRFLDFRLAKAMESAAGPAACRCREARPIT